DRAVDADPRIALALQIEEELLVLALAPADDRRQHQQPGARRLGEYPIDHLLDGLRRNDLAAARAVRHAHAREQHAKVVVDLGDGADGRARVLRRGLLFDRDRGREPLDRVHLGLLHLLEELPGVRRQRFHVAPLTFGVDGVEGERRLARAREPGDHDELVTRDLEVDVLEIVLAGAADDDPITGHGDSLYGSPRAAGPQPRDALRRARPLYGTTRAA